MQPGVKPGPQPMGRLPYPDPPIPQLQQPAQQDFSKVSNSKKFSNALVFLDHIKKKLEHQPGLYHEFLKVMSEFKSQVYVEWFHLHCYLWDAYFCRCDTPGVVNRVKLLFKNHPELIREFNEFLPQSIFFFFWFVNVTLLISLAMQIPEAEIEVKPKPVVTSARDYVQKIKVSFDFSLSDY